MYLNYKPRHVVVYSKSEYLYDIFDKVLLSLGKVFTGDNFDYTTLRRFSKKLDEVRSLYPDNTIYVDSGGYSIIVGDIPKHTISKLIDLYSYFISTYTDKFDRVFSLDIPLSLKLDINYYDTLLSLNTTSQEKTINAIKKSKELKNKLYFVWQFKTRKLFDIWKTVYNELKLWKYYNYYAVGGLVGLKNFANIKFSGYVVPILYTVMLYKEHYSKTFLKKELIYHVLGQYAAVDQLVILVIEEFIKRKYNLKFHITYDSAAIHSEFINLKDKALYFFDYNGKNECSVYDFDEDLDIHPHIQNNLKSFKNVIDNLCKNERMSDIDAARFIYGLHIVSREYIFNKIRGNIADILLDNKLTLKGKLNHIETYLKQTRNKYKTLSTVITDQFINTVNNNFKILLHMSNKYDVDTKDDMMYKFIDLIGLEEFIQ